MKIHHLMEMPQLTTNDVNWGLPEDLLNRRRVYLLLYNNPSPIRNFSSGKLYKTLQEVFFVSNDTGLIDYYMKFENGTIPGLGHCATQVKVWRRAGIGVRNLTSVVFYEIMLGEFDTMVSDRIQTVDGQRFWIDRLSESRADGRQIGLLDTGVIKPYDPKISLVNWLSLVDGWGTHAHYQEKRFFISNIALSREGQNSLTDTMPRTEEESLIQAVDPDNPPIVDFSHFISAEEYWKTKLKRWIEKKT